MENSGPYMMPCLCPGLERRCPGTSEVVTTLSAIALRSCVLVRGLSRPLFVHHAFESWERTPPIMADIVGGEALLCHLLCQ